MAALKKRGEVDREFTWRLEDMFATDDLALAAYEKLMEQIPLLDKFRGRLSESAVSLLEAVSFIENFWRKAEFVYTYASLRETEDLTNSFYKGFSDKCMTLFTKAGTATAYFEPELLAISEETVARFCEQEEGLKHYKHYFDRLFRKKPHILSVPEETVLAATMKVCSAPSNIFAMLENADMKFGTVKDSKGEEIELTTGRFISCLESSDRTLRENAFNAYYDVFIAHRHTIAATYAASVETDMFTSQTRKHASSIEHALFGDKIPVEVYKNLINSVHDNLPHMYKYVALRKKRLGVDELHMYDVYTPIVANVDTDISYGDAKETVLKALAPLGEDYLAAVREGLENRWIDVYENVGKRSGAFSSGCYDSNPYILLNFDGKISDMFTLAHEMGHSIHTYMSTKNQSVTYSDYPIFLAEVASTVNEALLWEYLMKTTSDPKMKEYLLNYYLEQFRGTLFRQTMFAEFEMLTHETAERGEPLTVDNLSALYHGLVKKYFGDGLTADEKIAYEWSRIPHFYRAFYVYKYATGFSAAVAFAKKILEEGAPAVEAYKGFLKSGGCDYPLEILKKAGVDMSSPKPVNDALSVFASVVAQLEAM